MDTRIEIQRIKNVMTMRGYDRFAFLLANQIGRDSSWDIRLIRPETPMKPVKTPPQSTRNASITTIYWKIAPPTIFASPARRKLENFAISDISEIPRQRSATRGLKTTTPRSILVSVFLNIPFSCSSMKSAELSKPETPRSDAENPRKSKIGSV